MVKCGVSKLNGKVRWEKPTWTQTHLDPMPPWTQRPLGPKPTWTQAHLDQSPLGPKPTWTQAHMYPNPLGPNQQCPLTQSPIGPNAHLEPRPTWTQTHLDPTILMWTSWDGKEAQWLRVSVSNTRRKVSRWRDLKPTRTQAHPGTSSQLD